MTDFLLQHEPDSQTTSLDEHWHRRFGGLTKLYTQDQIRRLRSARVAIIGLGGVGSWVAEALARSGVGFLHLVDMDEICLSNINRQLPALTSTAGRSKVDVMKNRLHDINPDLVLSGGEQWLNAESVSSLMPLQLDWVLDCIDGVTDKMALIYGCKQAQINIILSGAAGGQIDPAQVAFADLSLSTHDPLLGRIKRRLKKEKIIFPDDKMRWGIPTVFSTEAVRRCPDKLENKSGLDSDDGTTVSNACDSQYGSSVVVTATFGMLLAARAIDGIVKAKKV